MTFGNNAYGFNNESGEAKSSDIESDRTTQDETDSDAEWNPEVESWNEFQQRID